MEPRQRLGGGLGSHIALLFSRAGAVLLTYSVSSAVSCLATSLRIPLRSRIAGQPRGMLKGRVEKRRDRHSKEPACYMHGYQPKIDCPDHSSFFATAWTHFLHKGEKRTNLTHCGLALTDKGIKHPNANPTITELEKVKPTRKCLLGKHYLHSP